MKRKTNTRYLTQLSVLVAIELVLAYTPLGYLRVAPGLEISFLMVPVALGGMLMGPAAGAILGGVFGLTSFATCFGSSPFGATLLTIQPVYTFLVCFATRVLAGWLTAVIFKALAGKRDTAPAVAYVAAAVAGPVLNTVLFTGGLVLFFYNTEYIQGFVTALGATNPLMFAALFVGVAAVLEAVVGGVVATALAMGVSRGLGKRA